MGGGLRGAVGEEEEEEEGTFDEISNCQLLYFSSPACRNCLCLALFFSLSFFFYEPNEQSAPPTVPARHMAARSGKHTHTRTHTVPPPSHTR